MTVGIVMGSDSDWPVMKEAAAALEEFGVAHEADVVSAHRMPEEMLAYGKEAAGRGLSVIIAGAGGAAHLPGMLAAVTPLPVIGVPVPLKTLDGMDSLLSIVQMPAGVPVATVAIGGARNAGLLAVRILVNELAMRPHNTGHWTQDGAVTSQFENHLRAVLDLPLGSPAARAPWTVMVNILGGPDDQVGRLYDGYPHAMARDPRLRVHLYGKDLRPGRKVGHVNAYGDDLDDGLERARHAAAWFRGDLGDESE